MSTNSLTVLVDPHWEAALSDKQRKALSLLGQGVAPVMVASTLGCTEGLISQFLADPKFSEEVTKIRLVTLQKQTGIDNKYIEAEDKLVDKLLKSIPLMSKPMDIVRSLQVVNATKRRGVAGDVGTAGISQVVQITLPGAYAAKLVTNAQNQVVEVQDETGARSLITASSSSLDALAERTLGSSEETKGISDRETIASQVRELKVSSIEIPRIAEAPAAGLRRSLETKGAITEYDL